MNTSAPKPGDAALRAIFRRVALASLVSAVAACGGGGGSGDVSGPAPTPAPPPPAPPATVSITIAIEVPATSRAGTVWMRAGNGAVTRAAITGQDIQCSPADPGSLTCTLRNIPRGQVITLVAADANGTVEFGSTPFNARDADPRGPKSQFLEFSGPCATPERGVCVFTASTDQTITARYAPLKLTRLKFIGVVGWRVTITAPSKLGVIGNQSADPFQIVLVDPTSPSVALCETDPVLAVNCYSILTPRDTFIKYESLPPNGPAPSGSSGPLAFVGFDNNCGANTACTVSGDEDDNVTMKWEYYKCSRSAMNTVWNYGSSISGPLNETCVLTRP
ncbi:MAG: hypothetical protein ABL900_20350 [Burkholderiaceae bacterium]